MTPEQLAEMAATAHKSDNESAHSNFRAGYLTGYNKRDDTTNAENVEFAIRFAEWKDELYAKFNDGQYVSLNHYRKWQKDPNYLPEIYTTSDLLKIFESIGK